MSDYFMELCDARGQLAGTRVVLESCLNALTDESTSDIMRDVAIKMAKDELVTIAALLDKKIGE